MSEFIKNPLEAPIPPDHYLMPSPIYDAHRDLLPRLPRKAEYRPLFADDEVEKTYFPPEPLTIDTPEIQIALIGDKSARDIFDKGRKREADAGRAITVLALTRGELRLPVQIHLEHPGEQAAPLRAAEQSFAGPLRGLQPRGTADSNKLTTPEGPGENDDDSFFGGVEPASNAELGFVSGYRDGQARVPQPRAVPAAVAARTVLDPTTHPGQWVHPSAVGDADTDWRHTGQGTSAHPLHVTSEEGPDGKRWAATQEAPAPHKGRLKRLGAFLLGVADRVLYGPREDNAATRHSY